MAITDQMRGLPMEELIGGPLTASCIAQNNLANTMVTFINSIGFDENGGTKTLDFDLQRPVDTGTGTIETETIHVEAPVLAVVPIPALLIETVNIDFTMEVKTSTQSKSSVDASVEASASVGFGPWRASVKGSVSTHRENTRTSDNSAKYVVSVVARQQPASEGMAKLTDLFASCVEPLKVTPPSTGGTTP